jgi:hypothetical protein
MAVDMPPFRPLKSRAYWAKRALGIAVLLGVITLAADFWRWNLTKRLVSGEAATFEEIQMHDTVQSFVPFAELAAYALAGFFFLRWFYRAYANLRTFGAEGLPHGPGWAVGYWFVPFINLVRPATVALDIWNASDPGERSSSRRKGGRSGLVISWWLTFVLSGIATWAGIRLWNSAADPEALSRAAVVSVLADVVWVVAGLLAIAYVHGTTSRQETRASGLQGPLFDA